jgi:hypothetical protein
MIEGGKERLRVPRRISSILWMCSRIEKVDILSVFE